MTMQQTELTFHGYAPVVALAEESRTISGVITVFGLVAESHGLVIEEGALEPRMPLSRVKLLRDHNHTDPVGYMLTLSDDRTEASFHVAPGENGDRALFEAREKLRDGLSVGFRTTEYTWDDNYVLHVHKAELYEVSLCAIPAFQDAQVIDVAASLATRKENTPIMNRAQIAAALAAGTITQAQHDAALAALDAVQPAAQAQPVAAAQPAPQAAPAATALAVPERPDLAPVVLSGEQFAELSRIAAGGPAQSQTPAPRAQTTPRPVSLRQLAQEVASHVASGDRAAVRLALQDVVPADDAGEGFLRNDWRGELWTANRDDRPMIEALGTPSPLQTGSKVKGYVWDVKPDVQTYEGNKKPVPSNKPKTKPAEASVHRSAGGWDIDRIFVDLGDAAFLEAFWRAAVVDYKQDSETYAAGQLLAGATERPASTTLLRALGAMGADFAAIGASLDAIFIAPDLFEVYSALTQAEVPFWLANSTGISLRKQDATVGDLSIRTHPSLAAGQILGFDKRAATYFENTPPIRVNAVDLPKGGIDLGLFGYDAVLVNDPRAITKRQVTAPAGDAPAAAPVTQGE
ncbi:HK97 family phage prohead protease [Streptomyces sp. AC495_CC817]|uniref:HK97 family phage prohead protease n=1 Tax=Streptomyces sp. AC495_CC817 TaxID=2823900 RepID=UPI001C26EA2A|nr:HK97 family phage prohead protease [Streptomyces sp. AC495_CC817]